MQNHNSFGNMIYKIEIVKLCNYLMLPCRMIILNTKYCHTFTICTFWWMIQYKDPDTGQKVNYSEPVFCLIDRCLHYQDRHISPGLGPCPHLVIKCSP